MAKSRLPIELPPEEPSNTSLLGVGSIVPRIISEEMEKSYLDYAMSTIISRALPDVRDGMKPVHRRILFVMHESGLRSSAKYRKSATVVGDVLGKYHPHGDAAVYDAMVRLAQDFSMRYPLVDGQGNFGSIDGDSAAAHRYTEARMAKLADELLADIDKETVDFRPNYDARLQEPVVLPTRIPNLLINGTMGIAVGMATNIPPHNLGEVMEALTYLVDHPDCTIDDLMQFIQGPDFPTYGKIYDREAIRQAYATGRGSIVMRANAQIVEMKGNRQAIIIDQIPYQVNKADLIIKIAELVRDKKIVGITDIRDESNRISMRIVIELKKDAFANKILNQLYKMTVLQKNFGFNMIALVDGIQPQLLDLKAMLYYFLQHRKEVVIRRTTYDLARAQDREHILEGLKIALDHIDEVISTIRESETKDDAKVNLITRFKLSEIQAQAILEMRLQTLAGLERQKIEDELIAIKKLIAELKSILADESKVWSIIKNEFNEIKDKYGDERRTEVVPHAVERITNLDTIPNEEMIVTITRENYIKRVSTAAYKVQHRGGKGIVGMTTKEEDEIVRLLYTKNHNKLLFFTNFGRVFELPVYEIAQASRQAKGQAIINLLELKPEEKVTATLDVSEGKGQYLFFCTARGVVKKTEVTAFQNIRRTGIIALGLKEDDELLTVKQSTGDNDVMIFTRHGQSIRFAEKDVRPMGRSAAGVRGVKLKAADVVTKMDIIKDDNAAVYIITENGLGKRTPISDYRLQTRGGSGVKTIDLTKKTGDVAGVHILDDAFEGDFLIVSKTGQMIRIKANSFPKRGRVTQGVFIMRLTGNDKVASFSSLKQSQDSEAEAAAEEGDEDQESMI